MNSDNWGWVEITADDWRELRELWGEMMIAFPGVFIETTADFEAMSEADWRARAVSLTGVGCLAQAIRGDDGAWWGFVSGYVDEFSRERNVFVTHIHVRDGHAVEAALIERLLTWAGEQFVESVIAEVREDHAEVLERYNRYGFCVTGAVRRCAVDDRYLEVELARPLPSAAPADIQWRAVTQSALTA